MGEKKRHHHIYRDGQSLYSADSAVDCWVWLVENYGDYTIKIMNLMNIVLI